jgi:DNA-binding NarL/FixJ family response regulator
MPKVIICDDHAIVTDGLRSLIESESNWQVITSVSNGRELLVVLRLVRPDIILLDVDMPVLNGFETLKLLKEQYQDIKVIMITMHNEKALAKKFLALGAHGYLPKNADRESLFEALNKVYRGESSFDYEYEQKETQNVITQTESIHVSQLTDREIEILKMIASGYSNKEIASMLNISHRTVDTHRTNLMKKIEVSNVVGLVRYAFKNGLV